MIWESEMFKLLRTIVETAGFALDTSADAEVIIPIITAANTRENIRITTRTLEGHERRASPISCFVAPKQGVFETPKSCSCLFCAGKIPDAISSVPEDCGYCGGTREVPESSTSYMPCPKCRPGR